MNNQTYVVKQVSEPKEASDGRQYRVISVGPEADESGMWPRFTVFEEEPAFNLRLGSKIVGSAKGMKFIPHWEDYEKELENYEQFRNQKIQENVNPLD